MSNVFEFPSLSIDPDRHRLAVRWWKEATPIRVREYIEKGADVNARDELGNTALHSAVQFCEDPAVVKVLLGQGADVNVRDEDGWTPLHSIFGFGLDSSRGPASLPIVQLLLQAGSDVNAVNEKGHTALHIFLGGHRLQPPSRVAAAAQDLELCRALLAAGADVNLKSKDGNHSLLMALDVMWCENIDIYDALIEQGVDLNAVNEEKETPLFRAVQVCDPLIVKRLLKAGVDVNQLIDRPDSKRPEVMTALHWAVAFYNLTNFRGSIDRHHEIIKDLLDGGADVTIRDQDDMLAVDLLTDKSADTLPDELLSRLRVTGAAPVL